MAKSIAYQLLEWLKICWLAGEKGSIFTCSLRKSPFNYHVSCFGLNIIFLKNVVKWIIYLSILVFLINRCDNRCLLYLPVFVNEANWSSTLSRKTSIYYASYLALQSRRVCLSDNNYSSEYLITSLHDHRIAALTTGNGKRNGAGLYWELHRST